MLFVKLLLVLLHHLPSPLQSLERESFFLALALAFVCISNLEIMQSIESKIYLKNSVLKMLHKYFIKFRLNRESSRKWALRRKTSSRMSCLTCLLFAVFSKSFVSFRERNNWEDEWNQLPWASSKADVRKGEWKFLPSWKWST